MKEIVGYKQLKPASDPVKGNSLRMSIPTHLEQVFWLDFELDCAIGLWKSLKRELTRLVKRSSVNRVHDTRIALRRWNAAWKVLKQDGWESKAYRKKIGKKLRKLRTLLGNLRDWDVNLEIARMLALPNRVTDAWAKQRALAATQVRKELNSLKVQGLLKRLKVVLKKRHRRLQDRLKRSGYRKAPAYDHLEPYLQSLESASLGLEKQASTANELHQLRLSIKHWRYFLTEFFGLTNLQLVQAQQLLGKFNDLQRVLCLLEQDKIVKVKNVIAKIKEQQKTYLQEFEKVRKSLPFGLRPTTISLTG